MHVRVATNASSNDGISSSYAALPLNCVTNVRVEALGRQLHLYLNNTLDSAIFLSGDRVYGDAILYVSDPWHPAAIGTISPIELDQICELTQDAVHTSTSTLSRFLTFNRTTVPENYSLSFDITPTGISSVWTNILHYTKDNSDGGAAGGRMPGKIFLTATNNI